MLFNRPPADPASEPVLDDKAPLLSVERGGVTYQVSLDTWGAVLHSDGAPSIEVRSAASVAERTGLPETTIKAWLDAGALDYIEVRGTRFAVPDAHSRYPVRDPN